MTKWNAGMQAKDKFSTKNISCTFGCVRPIYHATTSKPRIITLRYLNSDSVKVPSLADTLTLE